MTSLYYLNVSATSNYVVPTVPPSAPTSISLQLGSNTAVYGEPVTLTAHITPQDEAHHPSGTVGFFDSNMLIGMAQVIDGVATLKTTMLPVGARSLTVVYSGDAENAATPRRRNTSGADGHASFGNTKAHRFD